MTNTPEQNAILSLQVDVTNIYAEIRILRQDIRNSVGIKDTLIQALDGLLIALSTGVGISDATDAAKAAMRPATGAK